MSATASTDNGDLSSRRFAVRTVKFTQILSDYHVVLFDELNLRIRFAQTKQTLLNGALDVVDEMVGFRGCWRHDLGDGLLELKMNLK